MTFHSTEEVKLTEPDGRFIPSKEYADKYGIEVRRIAGACRDNKYLIGKKISTKDPQRNRMVERWAVLDIPPDEHPGWKEYNDVHRLKQLHKDGGKYGKNFQEYAPVFLERFNIARIDIAEANFTQKQLADMLETTPVVIANWANVGIKDYGKLPRIPFPKDKRSKYKGRIDHYYRQQDIIRFLKKEFVNPRKKFKTIDDALKEENIDAIVADDGKYYVYEKRKKYPLTADGFIKWAEDNVMRYDKYLNKWLPFKPIGMQRDFYKKVFELTPTKTFKHRFIRICRPRGDFKSFDAILIFLFRFFNMAREKILLAANSKDQSDYALYDEARDIVINSPMLYGPYGVPGLKVKEKEIVLMSSQKDIFNRIKSIASKQGALSNATCIVFSEIYKLKDQQFVSELEGSIRGVVNAMSIIESTVSRVGTYYHRQYEAYIDNKSPLMYFQYYHDKHFNPNLTKDELEHYEASFFPNEFKMFFRNRWGDAGEGLFSIAQIYETRVLAVDGKLGPCPELTAAIQELLEMKQKLGQLKGVADTTQLERNIQVIESRFTYVDDLYQLPADSIDLENIKQKYDFHEFFVGAGLDRAEQLTARADRTALSTVAKAYLDANRWMCFVLDFFIPDSPKATPIKERIDYNTATYGWISQIDLEKSQCLDLWNWCQEQAYTATLQSASYEHQHEMFLELYRLVKEGLFKCPTVPLWHDNNDVVHSEIPPSGIEDLLREEMRVFEHEPRERGRKSGKFGSPFKKSSGTKKGDTKDDVVYSLGHAVFAANEGDVPATVMGTSFASIIQNTDVVGEY